MIYIQLHQESERVGDGQSKRIGDGNVNGVKEIEDREGERERERVKRERKCERKKKRVNVIQEKKMRKKRISEQHKRQDLCALWVLNAM